MLPLRVILVLSVVGVILISALWKRTNEDIQSVDNADLLNVAFSLNRTSAILSLINPTNPPTDLGPCRREISCTTCLNSSGCGWNGDLCVAGNWTGPNETSTANNSTWFWNTCNESEFNQTYFNDILAVIYWNTVRPSRVPLIAYFRRIFPNMLLVGANKPEVIGEGNYTSTIHPAPWFICKSGGVYCQYQCLAEVMQNYTYFRGYLMIHFDVLFNYWNTVGKFDRNNIWLVRPGSDAFEVCYRPDVQWHWNFKHSDLPKESDQGPAAVYWNLTSYVQQQINSTCSRPVSRYPNIPIDCGFSDAFYIPARYVDKYIFYSNLFYQFRVFLEIAVPTMLSWMVLDQKSDISYWEKFSFSGFVYYTTDLDLMHSVQFNSPSDVKRFYDIWEDKTFTFPSIGIVRVPKISTEEVPSYQILIEGRVVNMTIT